jgi:histone H3/H4
MISQDMMKKALYDAGAKQVSDDAAKAFEAWMLRFMTQAAAKAVQRMKADGRVKVARKDIGE